MLHSPSALGTLAQPISKTTAFNKMAYWKTLIPSDPANTSGTNVVFASFVVPAIFFVIQLCLVPLLIRVLHSDAAGLQGHKMDADSRLKSTTYITAVFGFMNLCCVAAEKHDPSRAHNGYADVIMRVARNYILFVKAEIIFGVVVLVIRRGWRVYRHVSSTRETLRQNIDVKTQPE
jgi:hypothetical protein